MAAYMNTGSPSIRDHNDFPNKMERHFPIKPGQPIGLALATVCFSSEFPN